MSNSRYLPIAESAQNARGRLDRIDHLRFAAALMVMIWHFAHAYVPEPLLPRLPLLAILSEGHTGVALFCVISGFIFAWLYLEKPIRYSQFAADRFRRIAPLFFFWIAFSFFLGNWDQLAIIGTLITGLFKRGSFPAYIEQGWTILVEAQFYAVFPFLLVFLRKYGAVYLVGLWGFLLFVRFGFFLDRGDVFFLSYATIFGRMDQFIAGMLVAYFFRTRALARSAKGALMALGVSAAVGLVLFYEAFTRYGGVFGQSGPFPFHKSIWITLPSIEAVCYAAILAGYLAASAVNLAIVRPLAAAAAYGGRISYSLYLNHLFVFLAIHAAFKSVGYKPEMWEEATLACLVVGLPAAFAFSTGTYFLIERPFLDLRKPVHDRSPVGTAASASDSPSLAGQSIPSGDDPRTNPERRVGRWSDARP